MPQKVSELRFPRIRGKIIVMDVETTGLYAYQGDRFFAVAYWTELGERGYYRNTPKTIRWLKRLFRDPTVTIVFHNAKFDLTMFYVEGIDVLNAKARVDCTMTMSKVLDSASIAGHALETLGPKLVDRDDSDKLAIKDWCKAHNSRSAVKARGYKVGFQHAPDDLVRRRILWDVETTYLLYEHFKPQVEEVCPTLYETERMLIFVCVDMESYGVKIDISKAKQLRDEAYEALDEIQEELEDMCLPITVKRKKKGVTVDEIIDKNLKITSNQHLEGMFNKLGIPLRFKSKPKKDKKTGEYKGGGNWTFDEYAMVRYVPPALSGCIREASEDGWSARKYLDEIHRIVEEKDMDPKFLIPPLVLRFRQLSKMISTYYNALIDKAVDVHTEPNGREVGILHCKFNPSEAMTGRFSCSDPNLQNIPRILGPRECFIPRKGKYNWHIDYSQVEMRLFCHFALDEGMAQAIDEDVHQYVATKIYRKPRDQISKEQRKRAKATNFGILYGSGAKTQAETLTKRGLPTTEHEAKVIVAAYHREFPKVRKLTNSLKSMLLKKGYVTNPFGRRYRIPSRAAYKALNYMCQGTSADLIKRAMVDIWLWLRENGYRTRLIMTVHDEVALEVPRSEAREVIPTIMTMMERLDEFFVPITVDAEVITTRWSEKQDPVEDLGLQWMKNAA